MHYPKNEKGEFYNMPKGEKVEEPKTLKESEKESQDAEKKIIEEEARLTPKTTEKTEPDLSVEKEKSAKNLDTRVKKKK